MKTINPQFERSLTVNFLTHLTLNTRHVTVRPLRSLDPMDAASLLPMLTTGVAFIPGLPTFTVTLARGQHDGLKICIAKCGIEVVVGALGNRPLMQPNFHHLKYLNILSRLWGAP